MQGIEFVDSDTSEALIAFKDRHKSLAGQQECDPLGMNRVRKHETRKTGNDEATTVLGEGKPERVLF